MANTTTLSSIATSCLVSQAIKKGQTLYSDLSVTTVNHSCSPNVAFDLSHPRSSTDIEQERYPAEWNLRTLSRPVAKGETLTFFYPSTEWDMGAPFTCNCEASVSGFSCFKGRILVTDLSLIRRTASVRFKEPSTSLSPSSSSKSSSTRISWRGSWPRRHRERLFRGRCAIEKHEGD
jgi:hypothetical protein